MFARRVMGWALVAGSMHFISAFLLFMGVQNYGFPAPEWIFVGVYKIYLYPLRLAALPLTMLPRSGQGLPDAQLLRVVLFGSSLFAVYCAGMWAVFQLRESWLSLSDRLKTGQL